MIDVAVRVSPGVVVAGVPFAPGAWMTWAHADHQIGGGTLDGLGDRGRATDRHLGGAVRSLDLEGVARHRGDLTEVEAATLAIAALAVASAGELAVASPGELSVGPIRRSVAAPVAVVATVVVDWCQTPYPMPRPATTPTTMPTTAPITVAFRAAPDMVDPLAGWSPKISSWAAVPGGGVEGELAGGPVGE